MRSGEDPLGSSLLWGSLSWLSVEGIVSFGVSPCSVFLCDVDSFMHVLGGLFSDGSLQDFRSAYSMFYFLSVLMSDGFRRFSGSLLLLLIRTVRSSLLHPPSSRRGLREGSVPATFLSRILVRSLSCLCCYVRGIARSRGRGRSRPRSSTRIQVRC